MKFVLIILILAFSVLSIDAQKIDNEKPQTFFIPAKGIISSMFGWRRTKSNGKRGELKFHRGIDVAGRYKSPVYAAGDGVVVFAAWNNGYGRFLEIKHDNGYTTAYGHFRKLMVEKGDTVKAGQIIGLMGNSGTTFSTVGGHGVHVHFEIRNDKEISWKNPKGALNPIKYLKNFKYADKYTKVDYFPELCYMPQKQACYIKNAEIINYKTEYKNSNFVIQRLNSLEAENIKINNLKPSCNITERAVSYEFKYKSKNKNLSVNTLEKLTAKEYEYNEPKSCKKIKTREVNYDYDYKTKTNSYYAIQLEAHRVKLTETEIKNLVKKYGIGSMQYVKANINNSIWYKYTTGIFESLDEAKEYRKKLVSKKIIPRGGICKIVNNKAEVTYW